MRKIVIFFLHHLQIQPHVIKNLTDELVSFVLIIANQAQFGVSYAGKFISPPKKNRTRKEKLDEEKPHSTRGNIFENLFFSIPTDEDLRRTYFWEARRLGEREREVCTSFLKMLWFFMIFNFALSDFHLFDWKNSLTPRPTPNDNFVLKSFGKPSGMAH